MDGVADLTTCDKENSAGVGLHDAVSELSLAADSPDVFLSLLLSIFVAVVVHLITQYLLKALIEVDQQLPYYYLVYTTLVNSAFRTR